MADEYYIKKAKQASALMTGDDKRLLSYIYNYLKDRQCGRLCRGSFYDKSGAHCLMGAVYLAHNGHYPDSESDIDDWIPISRWMFSFLSDINDHYRRWEAEYISPEGESDVVMYERYDRVRETILRIYTHLVEGDWRNYDPSKR